MINANCNVFNNYGILLTKCPENIMSFLKNQIDAIKNDFNSAKKHNKNLAGNIEHEFLLNNSSEFDNYILEVIQSYESQFNYRNSISVLNSPLELKVQNAWVNFMKKYEFNPPHSHSGIYSYVIWYDTPFDIKDEMIQPASKDSRSCTPGHFGFIYSNILGEMSTASIPVDKNMNGTLCMFPSKLLHFVNPFYTSDEYRISVAGNVCLNSENCQA